MIANDFPGFAEVFARKKNSLSRINHFLMLARTKEALELTECCTFCRGGSGVVKKVNKKEIKKVNHIISNANYQSSEAQRVASEFKALDCVDIMACGFDGRGGHNCWAVD